MSVVIYKDGVLAADSIIIQSSLVYTAPKVYPYRDSNNRYGAFGYTGNPSVAQETMRGYIEAGEKGFLRAQERMHELLPDNGSSIIIMPANAEYILSAGWFEPLMRLPCEPFAIGFNEGVSHASAMFQDGARFWTADQIIGRIIALQNRATEVYVREPIVKWSIAELNHKFLDAMMNHPIDGQFIAPRPVEAQ